MKLDYGTLLNPTPIKLSIGTLRKHTLREISTLSFDRFNLYEALLKINPESYYTKMCGEEGKAYWGSLKEDARDTMTMYDLILENDSVCVLYTELLNFFFEEFVIFKEGFFILLNQEVDLKEEIAPESIRGVINDSTFKQVLDLIQQICCIYEEEETMDGLKFKNNAARKIYEKILKGQKEKKARKKADVNFSLPNIISAVSNSHQTINPINVWDLTMFQLLDSFNRLQVNKVYDIDARRVSVWGDEKKTFNIALWYKNEYDKK